MAETNHKPVVDPVKMPKIKIDGKSVAQTSAWAIALAAILGFVAIFLSICSFTKGDWAFLTPLSAYITVMPQALSSLTSLFGGGSIFVPLGLLLGVFALAFGIYGFVTIGKVTDADALKKNWANVAKTFAILATITAIELVVIILFSLTSLGSKAKGIQKMIWLDYFLPTLLVGVAVAGISFVAKTIAGGKTANARMASFIGVGLGALGCLLAFIAQIVATNS